MLGKNGKIDPVSRSGSVPKSSRLVLGQRSIIPQNLVQKSVNNFLSSYAHYAPQTGGCVMCAIFCERNGRFAAVAKDGIKKSAHCFETITQLQPPLKNYWLYAAGYPDNRQTDRQTDRQTGRETYRLSQSLPQLLRWRR